VEQETSFLHSNLAIAWVVDRQLAHPAAHPKAGEVGGVILGFALAVFMPAVPFQIPMSKASPHPVGGKRRRNHYPLPWQRALKWHFLKRKHRVELSGKHVDDTRTQCCIFSHCKT
jgi:hypothetical protein